MEKILEFLKNSDNFVITSHQSPDGDNIGSSIAMTQYLKNMGKHAYHFLDDSAPLNLSFLTDRVKIYKSLEFKDVLKEQKYNLIVLDCGNRERVNIDDQIINNAQRILCIDHHQSNDNFGDLNYLDSEGSSTCELVYEILKELDEKKINEIVATALYTGLATDTGNFRFDCTKVSSFLMAADLMQKDARKQDVIKSVYQSDDYNYKKLEAELIQSYMKKEGNICIMKLSQDMLKKYSVDIKDTDNLVNITINIKSVEVGILIKEKEQGTIRVSFRSKEKVNVADLASNFGGGGHERAAGCTFKNMDMDQVENILMEKVKQYV